MARFSLLRSLFITFLAFNSSLLRPAFAEESDAISDDSKTGMVENTAETVVDKVEETVEAASDVIPEDPVEEGVQPSGEVEETDQDEIGEVGAVETVGDTVAPEETPRTSLMKEKVVDSAKKLFEKVKSLEKSDLKKLAAGAIGVWGVSLAVGWLTKSSAGGSTTIPEKKRR